MSELQTKGRETSELAEDVIILNCEFSVQDSECLQSMTLENERNSSIKILQGKKLQKTRWSRKNILKY